MKITVKRIILISFITLIIFYVLINIYGHNFYLYNANSWKKIISKSCLEFSDGCNKCGRAFPGSDRINCTIMGCGAYRKPV